MSDKPNPAQTEFELRWQQTFGELLTFRARVNAARE